MPQSERFKTLSKELTRLRKHLLPKKFNPTGTYSERVQTKVLAYRVLAHAEIEYFLEERAREIAISAIRTWKSTKHIGRTLLGLVAFSDIKHELPPASLEPEQQEQAKHWQKLLQMEARVEQCLSQFIAKVEDNHGVKEKNVLALLLPIGLKPEDIDPLWLTNMEGFGNERGHAAHVSGSVHRLKQAPDPRAEYERISGLLKDLAKLDASLNELT